MGNLLIRFRLLLSPIVWFLLPNLYVPEEQIRSILLVKTGSLRHASATLAALEKRFPGASITVLTEEREFEELQRDLRVASVKYYRTIWRYPGLFWHLRQQRYDLKVALFTKEATYEKFKTLSIPLSARKMLVYTEHGASSYWGLRDLQGMISFLPLSYYLGSGRAIFRRLLLVLATGLFSPFVLIYLLSWTAWVLIPWQRRVDRRKEMILERLHHAGTSSSLRSDLEG